MKPGLLPTRADPVAGAFVSTIVVASLLATPLMLVAAIVWMSRRLSRKSRRDPRVQQDS